MSKTYQRREFLAELAKIPCATLLLGVTGPLKVLADDGEGGYDAAEHYYAMGIQLEKCIGCGKCVQACKTENDVPEEPFYFRTWVERYVIYEDGDVQVDSPEGGINGFPPLDGEKKILRTFFVPKLCNHCDNPPCVQVCPVGATFRTPEGFVLIDHEHCIGCAYCVQACPYGARFINPVEHKSDKCDWCYHRVKAGKLPACVTVCPNKARLFGDLNDPDSEVSEIFAEDQWMVLKPHMHTDPTCFYIGLPREVI